MQDFIATSVRRAELYGWFATLFSRELCDTQIAEYGTYDVGSFLKSLATLDPMRDAVANLNDVIERLLNRKQRQLALATDFKCLFLEPQKGSSPYESSYRSQISPLQPFSTQQIQASLAQLDIDLVAKHQKPVDHLAIQLDLMSSLINLACYEDNTTARRANILAEQESILHEHLLVWSPHFEAVCRAADTFGFYGAIARLLGVFLSMDANYLNLVKSANESDLPL